MPDDPKDAAETPDTRRERVLAEARRILDGTPRTLAIWRNRLPTATITEAADLCREVWDAPYRESASDDRAVKDGACAGKAHWLQAQLGGVVASGFLPCGTYHAAVVLPIDGRLHVLDAGAVVPIEDYQFDLVGFYERTSDEYIRTRRQDGAAHFTARQACRVAGG